jgi:hypothetical protein
VQWFNKFSRWVMSEICNWSDATQRSLCIKFFLRCAIPALETRRLAFLLAVRETLLPLMHFSRAGCVKNAEGG